MDREIDDFRRIGHSFDTAVSIEIGANTNVIDAHHADGVFQMGHGIAYGGLARLPKKAVIHRCLGHTTLRCQCPKLVVRQVSGHVAQGLAVAMTANNRRSTDVQRIIKTLFATVTQVNHHAKAVHFADNLLAEVTHSAVGSRATCAVADGIVTVMTECDIRDSATGKVLHVPDVVLDSQSVLYSKHNAFAALRLIPIEVVGRSCQSHIGILAFYNAFYLVKDAVGIVLGCHSGHFSRLGMLRQIGNHGHCVVPSVGHFVQIIENSRVSLLEMNALGKEHRRVAMAIEGQDMAVETFRFGEFRTATHEPLKEFQAHFFKPFGVPLHADDRFFFAAFHGFDDAIGCSCRHTEPLSAVADGLMME